MGDARADALAAAARAEPGWAALSRRMLLNLGGAPHPDGLLEERFPAWMDALVDGLTGGLARDDALRPNQALVNSYAPRGGIAAHNDGPLYLPRAAILTLSGYAVLRFFEDDARVRPARRRQVGSVVLEPCSLLVFSERLYTDLKHGILACAADASSEAVPSDAANLHLVRDPAARVCVPRERERVSVTLRRAAKLANELRMLDADAERRRRALWWRSAVDEGGLES